MSNLQATRERLGLTQRDVAKRAGLSQGTISMLENGYTPKRAATHEVIARALGVPVEQISR